MLRHDAAVSPLASHRPDPADHCDSLRAVLGAPFEAYSGRLPENHVHFRVLAGQLLERGIEAAAEAGCLEPSGEAPAGIREVLVEFLLLNSRDEDRHYALRACCYLRLLGREKRSFDEIGEEFDVCRATVQTIYRQLQKRLGDFPGRGDKSPAARADCRRRRLGARKVHQPWQYAELWQTAA